MKNNILEHEKLVTERINKSFGVESNGINKAIDSSSLESNDNSLDELQKAHNIGDEKVYQGITYYVSGFNSKHIPLWRKKKGQTSGSLNSNTRDKKKEVKEENKKFQKEEVKPKEQKDDVKDNSKGISLGDLGLTPKQVHVYGGKNELSGFVSTYNDKVKYYLNRFTEQISSGTKEQIKTVIDYYYKNQKEGTNESFISYLKDLLRKVEKGTYSRELIDINGALAGDIVDGFAMSRAKRLLIGKLNKKFQKEEDKSKEEKKMLKNNSPKDESKEKKTNKDKSKESYKNYITRREDIKKKVSEAQKEMNDLGDREDSDGYSEGYKIFGNVSDFDYDIDTRKLSVYATDKAYGDNPPDRKTVISKKDFDDYDRTSGYTRNYRGEREPFCSNEHGAVSVYMMLKKKGVNVDKNKIKLITHFD